MAAKSRSFLRDRIADAPAWVLLVELFIGFGWLRAAVEKVIDPLWWDGSTISWFITVHTGDTLDWYRPVLDLVGPGRVFVALVVITLQFAVAASLLSGRYVGWGLSVGIFMNLNFLAGGAVNPSVFYLLCQGAVALWMAEQAATERDMVRPLWFVAAGGLVVSLISIPSVSTIHPADVIEDPGAIVVFVGALTVVACVLVYRRATGMSLLEKARRAAGPPKVSDLFAPEEGEPEDGVIHLGGGDGWRDVTYELPDTDPVPDRKQMAFEDERGR